MTVTVVQTVNAGFIGNVSSGSITFPAATITGNAIVVVIEPQGHQVSSVNYGSPAGTAFTQVVTSFNAPPEHTTDNNIYIYWLPSNPGGSSSIYFTNSAGSQTFAWAMEVSGLSGTVDTTNSFSASTESTSWSSGSITPASAGELLVGAVMTSGAQGALTGPSGWTNTTIYPNFALTGYQVITTTGSYAYSGTEGAPDFQGVVIAAFTGGGTTIQPVGNPPGGPWNLVFDDEFDIAYPTPYGTGANPNVWADHFLEGDLMRTNNSSEQQWYPHGFYGQSVANSILTLTAQNQNPQSVDPTCPNPLQSGGPAGTFTAGMISSHLGFAMTYGYWEARIQQPSPSSSWPAFWMLDRNNTWPPEIDIAEWQPPGHSGQDQLGYYNMADTWQSTYLSGDQNYHVWGCHVTSSTVTYYEDGAQVTSHTYDGTAVPWYAIFNYAVEGASGGSGYPAQYNIDYCRAWVTQGVPAAPAITSISPSTGVPTSGSVVVSFGAASGATSYRVTASPADSLADGNSNNSVTVGVVSGSSSPLTVTGLQNGCRYNFTVCAINSTGYSQESAPAGPQIINIQLLSTTLPGATQGTAYSAALSAQAGNPPYTWAITSGTLPAGLSLNASTGVISGTPAAAGTSTFTVKVSGATSWTGGTTVANSASGSVSIAVAGGSWTLVAQETFTTNTLATNFVVYNNGTATSYEADSWMASQVSVNTSAGELLLNAKLSGGAGSERVGGALYWTGGSGTPAIMKYGAWECDYSTQNQAGYAPVLLMWPYPDNGNWPQDGEIDIMEVYTTDNLTTCGQSNFHLSPTVGSSAHLMAPSATTNSSAANVTAGSYQLNVTTTHTVRLEWQATYIAVFVDGIQVSKTTDATWIPTELPMRLTMQQEFYGVADSSISSLNANTIITGMRAYVASTAPPANAAMSTLVDNFATNDLSAKWYNSSNATWSAGQVAIAVDTSANGQLGATSAYNLTGSSIITEVVPATGAAYTTNLVLGSGTNSILTGYQGGDLVATLTQNSAVSFTQSISYSPGSHKWWRIREQSGVIFWDAAPDGLAWTNLWSTAYTMNVTGLSPLFQASSTSGSATSFVENVGGNNVAVSASLAIATAMTSGALAGAYGHARLQIALAVKPSSVGYIPGEASFAISTSLSPRAIQKAAAELGVVTFISGAPQGWTFIGPADVTYPQYLGLTGALTAEPGEFTVYILPASGWPYQLAVPPPDGRWIGVASSSQAASLEAPAVHPRTPAPLTSKAKRHGTRPRSAYGDLGKER